MSVRRHPNRRERRVTGVSQTGTQEHAQPDAALIARAMRAVERYRDRPKHFLSADVLDMFVLADALAAETAAREHAERENELLRAAGQNIVNEWRGGDDQSLGVRIQIACEKWDALPNTSPLDADRLDACLVIADKVERGISTPADDLALIEHLRKLRAALAAVSDTAPGACPECHGDGTIQTAPYYPGPLGHDPQAVYDVACPVCGGTGNVPTERQQT